MEEYVERSFIISGLVTREKIHATTQLIHNCKFRLWVNDTYLGIEFQALGIGHSILDIGHSLRTFAAQKNCVA